MFAEDSGTVLVGGGGVVAVISFKNFGLPKSTDSNKVRAQRVYSAAFSVLVSSSLTTRSISIFSSAAFLSAAALSSGRLISPLMPK